MLNRNLTCIQLRSPRRLLLQSPKRNNIQRQLCLPYQLKRNARHISSINIISIVIHRKHQAREHRARLLQPSTLNFQPPS